ncbi:hypothetical protein [Roseomonas haemaphysalidis]|uniref:Uncharacterized protein n=1 Tax=Roseomonas haemaphysalidis TaxID=2768162 RepID=A0ABS3KW18_9PROT|nr:hypothetical protein [Roseomonas haemaphysalidis]MBO1081668.1 hypothetical protein [Roseomonas haemaphysalidis]
MTARTAARTDLRQAIASLLRLANADARDARTLAGAGGTRNAASLMHSGNSRLTEAVVASEQGDIRPPDLRRIDRRNPLKPALRQLDKFYDTPFTLEPEGFLPDPPSAASLREPLDTLAEALQRAVAHFGVDLDGAGPAATTDPLRPAVDATPPPAPAQNARRARAAEARRKRTASAASPPKVAAAHAPEPAPHPASAGLTSNRFWALVDRWPLSDLEALQLIGHAGGLTQKGTRPRFKLSDQEAEVISAMLAIDAHWPSSASIPRRGWPNHCVRRHSRVRRRSTTSGRPGCRACATAAVT